MSFWSRLAAFSFIHLHHLLSTLSPLLTVHHKSDLRYLLPKISTGSSVFTELPNSYVVCACDCLGGRAVFSFYLPTQRIDTLEFILGLEKSRPLETDTQGKVYLIQWKINPHSL